MWQVLLARPCMRNFDNFFTVQVHLNKIYRNKLCRHKQRNTARHSFQSQSTIIFTLCSLMINDLTVKDPNNSILVKFADDMTVRAPVKNNYDSAPAEINNIEK